MAVQVIEFQHKHIRGAGAVPTPTDFALDGEPVHSMFIWNPDDLKLFTLLPDLVTVKCVLDVNRLDGLEPLPTAISGGVVA